MKERESLCKITLNKKAKKKIEQGNQALEAILQEIEPDLTRYNEIVYATAKVLSDICSDRSKNKRKKTNRRKKPLWKEKIEKEIEYMRGQLSILSELQRGVNVKGKECRKLIRKFKVTEDNIDVVKETIKQKMQLKAQRLRRFDKRNRFYRQNMIFKKDAKKFYREVGKETITINEPPSMEAVEEFWKNIWSEEKEFNHETEWIKNTEEVNKNKEQQEWKKITKEELELALKKSHKWKSPGIDKIPNFWLNSLSKGHQKLAALLSCVVETPENAPDWLSEGITYLLPKTKETKNPKNYRPITCLTTTYKLLTSILTERTYNFMESNELFPIEQKGCKRGSYGCKDQLLINKMLLEHCKMKHRNMSMAWIDYRKAFDSVPHSWIVKALELFKISPTVVNFLKLNMLKWKTTLNLSYKDGNITSNSIDINCGIFQGDSLSPLLFCLCLIPLSAELNKTGYGYKIDNESINHLFYMDDLKLFAKDDDNLEGLLQTVKSFSDDIGMKFGLEKCAKATFIKGKLTNTTSIELENDTTIRELEQEEVYKYLGINESNRIKHATMKEKIRKECYRRVRAILKTELNSANRIEAINTLAIPVVTYSLNIINWTLPDIRKIDTKIRKLLTVNRMHHPKADIDRLYVPRADGGRGMIQLELTFKTTTIGLHKYLSTTKDWILQLVLNHDGKKKAHSITKQSQKFRQELNVETTTNEANPSTVQAKEIKKKAKAEGVKMIKKTWENKPLHGKYPMRSQQADVDQLNTHQWLRSVGLKAETEGFIMAAQDQSLFTRNYQARIIKNGADPKCRMCDQYDETIDHLVSGCPIIRPTEYKNRHDRVGHYIHWKICQHFNVKCEKNWYEHKPKPVVETKNATILWDFAIHTDRKIDANKPDITIKDHKNNVCLMVELMFPMDKNLSAGEFGKISKYKDLEIEIERMWHLKPKLIPVVVGALGTVKKGTNKYLEQIPGKPSLTEIQKIVLTSTAHILRKALSI